MELQSENGYRWNRKSVTFRHFCVCRRREMVTFREKSVHLVECCRNKANESSLQEKFLTLQYNYKSHLQGYHKEKPPEMDGFNYFRYSPRPEGGSLGYSSSSKLSNGPLRPERWSLVYSTFSSTPLSISFLACAEGSAE